MKVDTGAKCNVMSKDTFEQLSKGQIVKCWKTTNLVAYGGSRIQTAGLVSSRTLVPLKEKAESVIGAKGPSTQQLTVGTNKKNVMCVVK